ncbi:MAG: hypothetical protein OEY38_18880 [Gammaproteobacteria bacterium]|nr:hypothetical protein [Gammaproteobacteria bacterium]
MNTMQLAAYLFLILIGLAMLFQLALAFGAPWGEMTMAGKYPGRLPAAMRIAAIVQFLLLVLIGLIVSIRAGLLVQNYYDRSQSLTWVVVVFTLISVTLNSISPSKKERMLWAPVTLILFICSMIIGLS